MAFFSSIFYVLLCVFYAARATLRFTVEFLLFLPLYFCIERHDTRSRWFGHRGEAQLLPLLPTALRHEQVSSELSIGSSNNSNSGADGDQGEAEQEKLLLHHEDIILVSARQAQLGQTAKPRGVGGLEAGADSAGVVTRCATARAGLARMQSLRSARPWWQRTPVETPMTLQGDADSHSQSQASGLSSIASVSASDGAFTDDDENHERIEERGNVVRDGGGGAAAAAAAAASSLLVDSSSSSDGSAPLGRALYKKNGKSTESKPALVSPHDGPLGAHDHHTEYPAMTGAFFSGVMVSVAAETEARVHTALPRWCTPAVLHPLPHPQHHSAKPARCRGSAAPTRRGQLGFIPPWYAVHARAQLLLAHIDPLLRSVAELLLCLWGPAVDTAATSAASGAAESVTDTGDRGEPRVAAGGIAPHSASASGTVVPHVLYVACAQPLWWLCALLLRSLRSLTRLFFAGGSGGAGSNYRPLLQPSPAASLHGSLTHYARDTAHVFECFDTVSAAWTADVNGSAPPPRLKSEAAPPAQITGVAPGSDGQGGGEHQDAGSTPAAKPTPVTQCERALGVYWLHGRKPEATAAASTAPPLVILLLCPSLLQGSGLYPCSVTRISHLCQLLTLAGAWRAAATSSATGAGGASTGDPFHIQSGSRPAEWFAAVPVVEIRTATPDGHKGVSRPPLTLRDLQLIVERVRRAADTTGRRRVFVVAIGWSEAASPLLELAMTQQQQQQAQELSPAVCARLDGLVCLSHTLSTAFQLLPDVRGGPLTWRHAGWSQWASPASPSPSPPSAHPAARHGLVRDPSTSAVDGSRGYSGGRSYAEGHGGARASLYSMTSMHAAPRIPHVLSHLTTGPARLLLLLARLHLIADNLTEQRHADDAADEQQRKEERGGDEKSLQSQRYPSHGGTRDRSFYHMLERSREARELAHAAQRGVDAPMLLWRQCVQHQQQQQQQQQRTEKDLALSGRSESSGRSPAAGAAGATAGGAVTCADRSDDATTVDSSASAFRASPSTGQQLAAVPLAQHGLRDGTAAIPTACPTPVSRIRTRQLNALAADSVGSANRFISGAAAFDASFVFDAESGSSRRGSRTFATHLPLLQHHQQHFAAQLSTSTMRPHTPPSEGANASSSLFAASLPHLETLTDWEALVRTDAMAAAQAQQRHEVANATAAHLPHPPSLDSPMAYRAMDRPVAGNDEGTPESRGREKPRSRRNGRDAEATGVVVSPVTPLPAAQSTLRPLHAAVGPALRSIRNHMSTEDVVASCTLQCFTPTARRSSRYPDALRAGSLSQLESAAAAMQQQQQQQQQQGNGGGDGRSGSWYHAGASLTHASALQQQQHRDDGLLVRTAPSSPALSLAVPGGSSVWDSRTGDERGFHRAASAAPASAASGAAAALSSAVTDLADISFSSPVSMGREMPTEASFPHVNSALRQDSRFGFSASDYGAAVAPADHYGASADAAFAALPPQQFAGGLRSHHTDGSVDAVTAAARGAASLRLRPVDHFASPPFAGGAAGASERATAEASARPQLPPPPPPAGRSASVGAVTHHPSTLPSRTVNAQTAALVELHVRSAQHAALIQRIRIPALLLHARDDPVAPPSTVPFTLLQANPWITTVLTRRGSHAVFMEGVSEAWSRPYLVMEQQQQQPSLWSGGEACESGQGAVLGRAVPVKKERAGGVVDAERRDRDGRVDDGSRSRRVRATKKVSLTNDSSSSSSADEDDDSEGAEEQATVLHRPAHADAAATSTASDIPRKKKGEPSVSHGRTAAAQRWCLRVEGTTWVERLIFEYVEHVILASAD